MRLHLFLVATRGLIRPAGLAGGGAVEGGLAEDAAAAEDAAPGLAALFGGGALDGLDGVGDHLLPLFVGEVLEAWWSVEAEADDLRHLASLLGEEPVGALDDDLTAGALGLEGADAGPVVGLLHQVVFHRVGERVDHLVEAGFGVAALDDGGLLGGEEVFPAAPAGVEAFREQHVEALDEARVVAVLVVDAQVDVVRVCDEPQHLDFAVLGCLGEAIPDGAVGFGAGSEQEFPLRAPAGEEIDFVGEDGSWSCHTR